MGSPHSRGRKRISWRKDPIIQDRLVQVERLHLRGDSNRAVAKALGVDEKTIRIDLQHLRDLWLGCAGEKIEDLKARAIAELEDVRHRSLAAAEFDEDCERAVLFGKTAGGKKVSVQRGPKGAQFRGQKAQALQTARQASMDKAKILGLVVDKIAPTDADGRTLDLATLMQLARKPDER